MIVYDTETTGLLKPMDVPLEDQPHIIEFAAIKLNDKTLKEEDRFEFLCNPGFALDAIITKITSITDKMLEKEKPFGFYRPKLSAFFLGQVSMAAHNLGFDKGMLYNELLRLDAVTKFPWPPQHFCTVEISKPIKNYRLKLGLLHELATGKPHKEAHRAMADVEALCTCVRYLRKEGRM